MNDLDPPFSVEEHFARRVDPRWEELKELGNVLFKRGEYRNSIKLYSQALYISHGSIKSIPALFGVLRKSKRGSPAQRLSENPVLLVLISRFLLLPLANTEYWLCHGESVSVRLPNQPAAVCYSNRAAAYMKLASALEDTEESKNYLKKALKDAKLACKHCPGYAKGKSFCIIDIAIICYIGNFCL
jgi:tetratricopeptide (TPR) repeat protein